jgi:quinol-cytochrome oxidoreductase complex cytochrome b subunit
MSGIWMTVQVVSGLILSTVLVASSSTAFDSVVVLIESLNGGSIIRFIHANSCSMVFVMILVHVGKGLWYSSSSKSNL